MRESNNLSCLCFILCLFACTAYCPALIAAEPRVQFDAVTQVGCHDISPEGFQQIHPDERLIEAVFSISTFSSREDYADMDLVIQIISPQRTVQVVDYLPNTTVASEYAGNISHNDTNEKSYTIGLNAGGSIADIVNLSGNVGATDKKTRNTQFQKLPPTQILSASGTLQRGSGVYFKLKPSSQTTLEGSHNFILTLRVPRTWRGDIMQVHCRARKFVKGNLFAEDKIASTGSASFQVAMYLDHHRQAKQLAQAMVDAEQSLIASARRHAHSIEKSSTDSKFAFVTVSEAKVPSDWLAQIMFDPNPKSLPAFVKQLPESVRDAAIDYAVAKSRMLLISE
jgi:hypothetical protein